MSLPASEIPPAISRRRSGLTAQHALLILALLMGAFFRSSAVSRMSDMLHYDEAYNGMDALSLLRVPRLTPFFPGNYGREAGWIYYLAPFVAAFGARPIALRLAAAFAGVLTMAAVYSLGRLVIGRRASAWATAVWAVFYWPVQLNHLALRANLLPLVGCLAFATLLRAKRSRRAALWVAGGVWLGLLVYTYYSAWLWMGCGVLWLLWWVWKEPKARRGALIALGAAALVCLPMLVYTIRHPMAPVRLEMVGTLSPRSVAANILLWGRAWLQRGDPNAEFNLPGRPILDPALGVLFVAGIIALVGSRRRHKAGFLLLGLGLASILPSLLSDQAPHFLRAIGLTVPTALVAGVGAAVATDAARRVFKERTALVFPLALLAVSALVSYRDFHSRWLHSPEVPIFMEQHINQGIDYVRTNVSPDAPVYFSPFTMSHPVLTFRAADLAPRPVGAADSHYCLPIPDRPAAYFSLTLYEPNFECWLSQWADLTLLVRRPTSSGDQVLYSIYRATPHADWVADEGVAVFGYALRMRLMLPVSTTVRVGEVIRVSLGLQALHPLDRDYSVFVHLYGDPTPYEGGRMWGQGDSQACATYPSRMWRTDECVVQDFQLQVAPDIPAGSYQVAVGVYESPTGPRLPITWPGPRPNDYVALGTVQVTPASTGP